MGFGVYIHFPYCRSKCRYCDFFSMTVPIPHAEYAKALAGELRLRQAALGGRQAGSVYIGGGTPSLWRPEAVGQVMEALGRHIPFSEDAERTIEANPGTVNQAVLEDFVSAGLNRISIGAQSFRDELLAAVGRAHLRDDIVRSVELARAAGFGNVSLDLIYGLPDQTREDALSDAAAALSLTPDHLSVYELMVRDLESMTPLARDVQAGRVHLPGEEEVFLMGESLLERLKAAGMERYEISSFARNGRRSRHNQLYWTGGEYLGLGIGASGFLLRDPLHPDKGGRRWRNHRSPKRYFADVAAGRLPEEESEPLDAQTLFKERIQQGLRQTDGLDVELSGASLGIPRQVLDGIWRRSAPLVREGWMVREGSALRLTRRGLDLHTDLVLRLLD